jgi:ABC-type lipoprotein release transport system permease subunit
MWNSFVPIETLRALYQLRPDATGVVQIMLKPGEIDHVTAIAARLRSSLEKSGYRVMDPEPQAFWMKFQSVSREDWTGQKLDVTTWTDEISFITWVLDALQWLTRVLIGILMCIVGIGIMNTMWIAIRERTREIGTLRAIGMQRGSVLWMFMLESLMLGLFGTIVGAVAGTLLAGSLNKANIPVAPGLQFILMSDHLRLAVHAPMVVFAIAFITIVTGAAALFPSRRASLLRPVVAMSHFG